VPAEVMQVDFGVRWEPNAPDAVLATDDRGGAALALRAHFDDPDQRTVVLRWNHCLGVVDGPYNDEALHLHPLYESGLRDVLWAAEVRGSQWLESIRLAVAPNAFAGLRHFLLPLKERTVEVAARDLEISRSDAEPSAAAAAAL
jgi:hypothetical protein